MWSGVVVGRECVRVRKVKPVHIVRWFDMWQMFVVGVSGCPLGECGGWAVVKCVHIMRRVDRTGSGMVGVQTDGSVPYVQRVVNVTLITVAAIVAFLKKPDLWRRATMAGACGRTNVKN